MTQGLTKLMFFLVAAIGCVFTSAHAADEEGVKVGGAVRFQYSYESYNDGNRSRGGDIDLDTVRLNFDGSMAGVIVSAEWRYYQYMQVFHHGWVGYQFTDELRGELGITQVPFGNLPYNSHSFFFSSNYYLGLEDDYDAGMKFSWLSGPWDLRVGLFKNDELGGIDGYVSDRNDRYSYDAINDPERGEVGENNTLVGRAAYTFEAGDDASAQVGISTLRGQLHDGSAVSGSYAALAPHLSADYGSYNLQLQATKYKYDMNSNAETMGVGAYAYADAIPAEATSYTANVAYRLPTDWGPISALTFYFDNSLVINKSDDSEDTVMNVLGMMLEAGSVFTYLDFVSAKNQPFIGGSVIGDSNNREERINMNVGYYF